MIDTIETHRKTSSFWLSARANAVSPADAVAGVRSRTNVFIHGAAATPTPLIEALAARRDLEDVRLYHLHTAGPGAVRRAGPRAASSSRTRSSSAPRCARPSPPAGPTSCRSSSRTSRRSSRAASSSSTPRCCSSRRPTSTGCAPSAPRPTPPRPRPTPPGIVIAEINEQMPRTHGNNVVPFSRINAFIATDRPLHEHKAEPRDPDRGAHRRDRRRRWSRTARPCRWASAASPTPCWPACGDKHDLGVHTEMFSDRVIDLVESGAVTNRSRRCGQGRIVTSFINGTRRALRLRRRQPAGRVLPLRLDERHLDHPPEPEGGRDQLGHPDRPDRAGLRRLDRPPDLLGHRRPDGLHPRGGAVAGRQAHHRAARRRPAAGKVSRIVTQLEPGAGVVTTRGHVHWVVTEYGAVNLHGRSLRERGEALISIAHPDFRAELRQGALSGQAFPGGRLAGRAPRGAPPRNAQPIPKCAQWPLERGAILTHGP